MADHALQQTADEHQLLERARQRDREAIRQLVKHALLSHPHPPVFPPARGQTDTTLTIRMDLEVAISLYSQLGELGRSAGWLAKEKD
jgi:hypothetical protein